MEYNEKIYLSKYNSDWENQFSEEKKLLQTCFPNIPIEHFGSTSIKGMTAKPIVDIMLGVTSYPPSESMIINLEKLGYYNFGEEDKANGRTYFVKRGDETFVRKHGIFRTNYFPVLQANLCSLSFT